MVSAVPHRESLSVTVSHRLLVGPCALAMAVPNMFSFAKGIESGIRFIDWSCVRPFACAHSVRTRVPMETRTHARKHGAGGRIDRQTDRATGQLTDGRRAGRTDRLGCMDAYTRKRTTGRRTGRPTD